MMQPATALVFSDYSSGHDMGSHPENQTRMTAIRQRLEQAGLLENRPVYSAEPAEPSVLAWVHHPDMIELTREISESGGGAIDGDTLVAPGSWEAALAAAGAGIQAVDLVLSGRHKTTFSIARPPGHHAERSRQMGFCLFNSIAIAAVHAMETHGLGRIAILDWDVHHGNGTQDIFYDSSHVFFCSLHQWPLFPGSGLENETGVGDGEGYTLNVPLPAGSNDRDYLAVMDEIVKPALDEFRPELILVSAGFDAHQDDPLADMAVSEQGFRRMTQRVQRWADELTNGQLALVLEGGYNLRALSDSVVAVLQTLDETAPDERANT